MITRVGITSIFVTHDQDEAIEVADEIIITNHGHIEQAGNLQPAEDTVCHRVHGKSDQNQQYHQLPWV